MVAIDKKKNKMMRCDIQIKHISTHCYQTFNGGFLGLIVGGCWTQTQSGENAIFGKRRMKERKDN
jgi:hypothetical protein